MMYATLTALLLAQVVSGAQVHASTTLQGSRRLAEQDASHRDLLVAKVDNCGSLDMPVCSGEAMDDRMYECDYGFIGKAGICVPWMASSGGGATPTPVTESTTPTLKSSKGGFEFNGEMTYYGGAGSGGACTQNWVPPGFNTVALNGPQYEAQNECGTCVYACWDNKEVGQGERCIEAIIDNKCPECAYGDLDLGESGSGRWPVEWKKIPCPKSGGLKFSKQGSNASYAKVKVEGGPSSVISMMCNGMQGKGTPDSYYEFLDNFNQNLDQGMDCTVTFSDGESMSGKGV